MARSSLEMSAFHGVDKSLVELIESMYTQTKCSVMVNGKITEWLDVITGVIQGCLLSPSLFNYSWNM